MSHHKLIYRVFPDDQEVTNQEWRRADEWSEGLKIFSDFNEAWSFAHLAKLSTQVSWIIMEVPVGGVRPSLCTCWEV